MFASPEELATKGRDGGMADTKVSKTFVRKDMWVRLPLPAHMDKRVFIVHRWEGNQDSDWYPWLKVELEKKGYYVFVPALPDTNSPTPTKWIHALSEIVGTPTVNDYFIGHSIGCMTILRYFETLPLSETVGGAIFVAGFYKDLDYSGYKNNLASFFTKPLVWTKIKNICSQILGVYSDDDPWIPLIHAEILRKKLQSEITILSDCKHFTSEDGITNLPLVRDQLLKMAG